MLHVERDTEAEPKQTLCKDDANLMQAWREDGAALVRPWCEEGGRYNFYLRVYKISPFFSKFASQEFP